MVSLIVEEEGIGIVWAIGGHPVVVDDVFRDGKGGKGFPPVGVVVRVGEWPCWEWRVGKRLI